jgi:hypothetical protein
MAILQVVISLVLLIPAFVNVKRIPSVPLNSDLSTDQYSDKAFKVSGECIMFIVYELWRLWLAIDGVKHFQSRIKLVFILFFSVTLDYEVEFENNLCISMFYYTFIPL